jgi:uncharacterized protein (DUF486 family)
MREGLCSLVIQRQCALVSTAPKDACPFRLYSRLRRDKVLPMTLNIVRFCVAMFECVLVIPCVFLGHREVCSVSHCVSLPIMQYPDLMLRFWTVRLLCYRLRVGRCSGTATVSTCDPIGRVSFLVLIILPGVWCFRVLSDFSRILSIVCPCFLWVGCHSRSCLVPWMLAWDYSVCCRKLVEMECQSPHLVDVVYIRARLSPMQSRSCLAIFSVS